MYHDHHKLLFDTQTSFMAMGGLSSVAKFWRLDLSHPNNRGAYCSPVVFAGAVSIVWAVEKKLATLMYIRMCHEDFAGFLCSQSLLRA